MSESWQANRLRIEDRLDQLREDVQAHETALHAQGEKLAQALWVIQEASQTGPLASRLAKDQLKLNILDERLLSLETRLQDELNSIRADYTILKGLAAQGVEDKATDKLKSDRRLQIDLENTKGKWVVVGLLVTNLFTLIALLLKQ